jgi:hypothetical protein
MIVTFKELPGDLAATIEGIVNRVSVEKYRLTWESDSPIGNLYASITWAKGRRVRFTIETRDAYKHGSRRSANGRHMRKASWEAHRDVMRAILTLDRNATISTGFATYRGLYDFETKHENTADHNVGPQVQPVTIRECSV